MRQWIVQAAYIMNPPPPPQALPAPQMGDPTALPPGAPPPMMLGPGPQPGDPNTMPMMGPDPTAGTPMSSVAAGTYAPMVS